MIKYIIVLDVVGLELNHIYSGLVPNIANIAAEGESVKMEPVFPALTCPVQSSILSGTYPNQHGIIANGLYDRDNYVPSFWEQSSALVQTDRIWDIVKKRQQQNKSSNSLSPSLSSFKTGVLFWQNTLYAKSDIVVTPRPLHMEDGLIMWCYSKPTGFYDRELKEMFGEFNLATYWGPFASNKSSEWISKATEYTLEKKRPNLLFTYIPHIDYSAQRFGKNSNQVRDDLKKADELVGNIIKKTVELGIKDKTQFIILSEYGFNDVRTAVPLNLKLRDEDLLHTRTIQGKEYIDYEFSSAFAMVDHQIAHIYVKEGFVEQARSVLENTAGIDKILCSEGKKNLKIDHERSGELIAISDIDKWFSYYWWYDSEMSPVFAKTVDIHRKPGYDPVELFIDPKTKSIPLDPHLVKGSHGRPADPLTEEGYSVYISNRKSDNLKSNSPTSINCISIGQYLNSLISYL
ncbi:MAG TPA: nucleotide pyrophosphatase/phosphodiesterase family protein [Nitrososphaeraceae archaeon]|nr:nucleotide pyrophosphatase/phosphodiesterase family protein [Nitrososphaeraceae archaeon]